jgi:UDP-4-amino-4,6-dideoxy-N-acetyl-beta-L-altrosamine N-acetyltransferase
MKHVELTVRTLELKSYYLLSRKEQLQILLWRNHPSVRNLFFQQSEISESEHLAFVKSLKSDESRRYWMVFHKGEPIGSIDLYRISDRDCYWGYFLAPEKQKSALGVFMEFAVQEIAFDIMHLEQLHSETFDHNANVLKIHRQFQFVETARERGRVYMTAERRIWNQNKALFEELIALLLR